MIARTLFPTVTLARALRQRPASFNPADKETQP